MADKCTKTINKYIKQLKLNATPFKHLDSVQITQSLNTLMNTIDIILHTKHLDIQTAIDKIPHDTAILIAMVKILHWCKKSIDIKYVKSFMCHNKYTICKMYHILTNWGLIMLECTHFINKNVDLLNNAVLHQKHILMNMQQVKTCINTLNLNNRQRIINGYNLLSSALYLRLNYFTYCDIPITPKHAKFNDDLAELIQDLYNSMRLKNIHIAKFKF